VAAEATAAVQKPAGGAALPSAMMIDAEGGADSAGGVEVLWAGADAESSTSLRPAAGLVAKVGW
jgi:hypothetical protein